MIVRAGRTVVSASAAIALLAIILHCGRERPDGVPANADYQKRLGIWIEESDNGPVRNYYSDGSLAVLGQRVDGLRTGEWKTFLRDGTITSIGHYEQDWRVGTWKHYNDEGKLYLTIEYRLEPRRSFGLLETTDYGNENGPYRRYFANGQLEEEGAFWSGYFQGPIRRFFPDGQVAMTGQYREDLPIGEWRHYRPDGSLRRVENFRDGKLHGRVRAYYPDGSLYQDLEFLDGEQTDVALNPLPTSAH